MTHADKTETGWFVYMIEADDGSYYTGISTNIERRFEEHYGKTCGAKFFNGRTPLKIVYREAGHDRSSASKREFAIKKLGRIQKQRLIDSQLADAEHA